jgi:hypothetical protein
VLRVKQPLRIGDDFDSEAVPRRTKLRNARLVSPLWQGDGCVGLSGLYAIVNGIRLTLAHKHVMNAIEVHELLVAGMRFLSSRLTPQQALLSGLRVTLWRGLAEAMTEMARRQFGDWIWVERLYPTELGRDAAFATLEDAVLRIRAPMMLCRGGHYTIMSGFTPSSLLLFDSGGACRITRQLTGVPGDCDGARHVIYPNSFLALVA